ncbi:pyridoxal-phosphate dependent enzyme [Frondihabitans sucicola]|uniref:pyridoxal-phosphate dependent enzyme n=1 Tax=Frondihabitans sucicola TaxID=1268041 RepID=UPI003D9AC90F
MGLAAYAAHLGYRSVVFTSSATSREKRSLLTAYGAELRLVDTFVPKSHPDSMRAVAERFVDATPGAWLAGQYDNPANPEAHWLTTGPELWDETEGRITHLVATVGTGGTISGTGGHLKKVSGGRVQVVGADPITSTYSGGDGSAKYIEGAGHFVHPDADVDPWPESLDTSVIDRYLAVDDRTAIETIRELARTEGILAGGSSGVALAAAFRLAEELTADDTVVVILPDSGRAYLSTYFDDGWLRETGFSDDSDVRTVRDVVTSEGDFDPITIDRTSTVHDARNELRSKEVEPDSPVLVVYERSRAQPLHPGEVSGWTTVRRLAEVEAAEGGDSSVGRIAWPAPPRIPIGLPASEAIARLDAEDPRWAAALVLEDGRVGGVLSPRDTP